MPAMTGQPGAATILEHSIASVPAGLRAVLDALPAGVAWLHDLRNAANGVGIALEMIELLLQHDDRPAVIRSLARAQRGCAHLLALVRAPIEDESDASL